MVRLTKEALINGANDLKEVELQTIEGSVVIRPLTQSEVIHYQTITAKAMGVFETNDRGRRGVDTKASIDIEKTTIANGEAQAYAISTSLSNNGETYTVEDVKLMNGALFKELFEKVAEISGLDDNVEEDVERFLE